jgi:hypothetical protein
MPCKRSGPAEGGGAEGVSFMEHLPLWNWLGRFSSSDAHMMKYKAMQHTLAPTCPLQSKVFGLRLGFRH